MLSPVQFESYPSLRRANRYSLTYNTAQRCRKRRGEAIYLLKDSIDLSRSDFRAIDVVLVLEDERESISARC